MTYKGCSGSSKAFPRKKIIAEHFDVAKHVCFFLKRERLVQTLVFFFFFFCTGEIHAKLRGYEINLKSKGSLEHFEQPSYI